MWRQLLDLPGIFLHNVGERAVGQGLPRRVFSPTHAHKQAIALAHGVLLNQRRASGLVLLIGEAFPLAFQSFQQTRAAFGVVLAQLLQVGVDLAPHIDGNLHNAPLVTLPVSNDGDVMSLAHGKVGDPQRGASERRMPLRSSSKIMV